VSSDALGHSVPQALPAAAMKAADLGLVGVAAEVAADFEVAFPDAVFTSGRRSVAEQAEAMACNVVLNRAWIRETYVPSRVSAACQTWVDTVPQPVNHANIAAGLARVLSGFSDAELARLSLHMGGGAFDVSPATVSDEAQAWLVARAAKEGGRVLFREGGLRRVHAQFPPVTL
jgi:hypothetical protein